MRLPRPIQNSLLPLLLVFAAQKICAQLAPADDFFNSGAQFYISNNVPSALERTEDGLKLYPSDEKLQKLEKLLKQQQQSQSSQSQQNQQQSQSQQNSKGQQNQQQNQQESQQNSQDQKKSDEQKQSEQQKPSEQKSNDEKKEDQNGEKQTPAGQMTPEEAKRLLDAQKGDEQVLQFKPAGKPGDSQPPVKDW